MIKAFEDDYGVEVRHAWGMTEMSPLGSIGSIKPHAAGATARGRPRAQGQAGLGAVRRRNEDRRRREPRTALGRQALRPPEGRRPRGRAKSYFKGEGGQILDENGFFDTGDVATIDPDGYMQITDRAKDVIKSGGEWISSIDIENLAVGHPDVAEAAVIGDRPSQVGRAAAAGRRAEGRQDAATPRKCSASCEGRIAKWWMPDDMQMVKEIPHTATGKINKLKLRETFKDYKLPTT